MEAEVSLNFIELAPGDKANYGDDRVGDMTGKSEFSDMADHDIVLADVTAASLALRNGVLAANGGNKAQKDALKPLITAWDKKMKKVAKYVTEKAQAKDTIDEQIAVINVSGFAYNKVTRTETEAPGQTTNFTMTPAVVSGRSKIKSDSLGERITYISIFHKQPELLDAITFNNNQVQLPATTEPFIMHTTTDSRETEVTLSPAVKWYGVRFAINRKGTGAVSLKASAIPQ
jgi:hypothetical protein